MAAILVVDPDPIQIEALRRTIATAGHAFLHADTVTAAIDILRDGGVDLAIIHYTDGISLDEMSEGLRRLPDQPPFLLISGAIDAPSMSARHGAAEFIARPWQEEELERAIRRVLEERAPHTEFEETPTRPNERKE